MADARETKSVVVTPEVHDYAVAHGNTRPCAGRGLAQLT